MLLLFETLLLWYTYIFTSVFAHHCHLHLRLPVWDLRSFFSLPEIHLLEYSLVRVCCWKTFCLKYLHLSFIPEDGFSKSVHSMLAVIFFLAIFGIILFSSAFYCWKICNPCNCRSLLSICCFIMSSFWTFVLGSLHFHFDMSRSWFLFIYHAWNSLGFGIWKLV